LIDAEVILVDPAEARNAAAVAQLLVGEREARIERIEESVSPVDVLAEAPIHIEDSGNRKFRRKRNRGDGRRGREGAIVVRGRAADPARRVRTIDALAGRALDLEVTRAVARRDSPHAGAVVLAAQRILDRVGALRVDGTAGVLEVIDAALPHVRVLHLPEVEPHLRI